MTKEEAWFWLGNIPDMWQGKIKKLMDVFSGPEEVYLADEKQLRTVKGMRKKDIAQILEAQKKDGFRKMQEEMAGKGILFYYPEHPQYPKRLKQLEDLPYTLYVIGKCPDDEKPAVALVGTRDPGNYGVCMTERLAKSLAQYGIQTVSGMARGIDGACHRGTLEGKGETYAVLGSGVDVCYPKEHRSLYSRIALTGGILSEYPLGRAPFAWQFPLRNRLISGLCDLLIVMEAKEKSGTFITVDYALDQGKDIFALPGRVTDEKSKGCNRLIKTGAFMLTDTADILEILGIRQKKTAARINLTEREKDIYEALDFIPQETESIAEHAGCTVSEAAILLTKLVLKGVAGEEMKCYYKKKVI